jgi:hypothetical protein
LFLVVVVRFRFLTGGSPCTMARELLRWTMNESEDEQMNETRMPFL